MNPVNRRNIRNLGALLALALFTALPATEVLAIIPCCSIVAIDKATGVVTLRDNKTGKTETVTVKDPEQLKKLAVGQAAERTIGMPAAKR
jgi:hypothetical protein